MAKRTTDSLSPRYKWTSMLIREDFSTVRPNTFQGGYWYFLNCFYLL